MVSTSTTENYKEAIHCILSDDLFKDFPEIRKAKIKNQLSNCSLEFIHELTRQKNIFKGLDLEGKLRGFSDLIELFGKSIAPDTNLKRISIAVEHGLNKYLTFKELGDFAKTGKGTIDIESFVKRTSLARDVAELYKNDLSKNDIKEILINTLKGKDLLQTTAAVETQITAFAEPTIVYNAAKQKG